MTLDIPQFIANAVRTQSKIHHLDINVKAVAKNDIPASVKSLITKDYGNKYLDDADYVAFFWGGIDKKQIEKLFNVVDKALGKSANKLTNKDFKKISMKSSSSINDEIEDEDSNDEEDIDVEVDDEAESSKELNEDDEEVDVEVDDDNDEESDDDLDDEESDDEDEEIEVDVVEEKPIPTAYFFLKITMK